MTIRKYIIYLQKQQTKLIGEMGATNLFLLFLLVIATCYPLFFVGFTTHDDANLAINVWKGNLWDITKEKSIEQGRFVFYWDFPLSAIPYVFDNRLWYLATKFVSFFFLLAALYYAVARLFKSKWLAMVSLALFLAIIQNGWEHNALTSYPVVFNLLGVFFLVSLGLYATAVDFNIHRFNSYAG